MCSAALRFLPAPERPGMRDRKSENPNRAPCAARKIPKAANQTAVKSSSRGQCRQQVRGRTADGSLVFAAPGQGRAGQTKKTGRTFLCAPPVLHLRSHSLIPVIHYFSDRSLIFMSYLFRLFCGSLPFVQKLLNVNVVTDSCSCCFR